MEGTPVRLPGWYRIGVMISSSGAHHAGFSWGCLCGTLMGGVFPPGAL